jgi:glucose/arabinose dehydrogenase
VNEGDRLGDDLVPDYFTSLIVSIPFREGDRPLGYYEDFLTGFLTDPTVPASARPVELLVLSDGSLLLAEDGNSVIYRISY